MGVPFGAVILVGSVGSVGSISSVSDLNESWVGVSEQLRDDNIWKDLINVN